MNDTETPKDHPLSRLAVRLGELLDEDQWAECESLVLKAWEAGNKERMALAGLPDGALDGGWTAAGMSAYAKKLEVENEQLRLAEEGAKEAFVHVVQQKRDLETECKRLRTLLDSAHDMIGQAQKRHNAVAQRAHACGRSGAAESSTAQTTETKR